MHKKKIAICLGVATAIGTTVFLQSNIDFAALSEQSTEKVIKGLNSLASNNIIGNVITDYNKYKTEKENESLEEYTDYKDDAIYLEALKSDKALLARIEKELEISEKEVISDIPTTKSEFSDDTIALQSVGEIPGLNKASEDSLSSAINPGHFELPSSIPNNIPRSTNSSEKKEEIVVRLSSESNSEVIKEEEKENSSVDTDKKENNVEDEKSVKTDKTEDETKTSTTNIDNNDTAKEKSDSKNKDDKKYTVIKDVYIRSSSDTNSKILGTLTKGTEIQGQSDNYWIKTNYQDQEAYVSVKFVASNNDEVINKNRDTTSIEESIELQEEVSLSGKNSEENQKVDVKKENTEETLDKKSNESDINLKNEDDIKYTVIKDVYIRDEADTDSNIIGTLTKGTEIFGQADSYWVKTLYQGKEAYISVNYVSSSVVSPEKDEVKLEESAKSNENKSTTAKQMVYVDEGNKNKGTSIDSIISEAEKLIGTSYTWAGSSPEQGFDCSGFVYYLYQKFAGVNLARKSSAMTSNGYEVSKETLKPGDLVFFKEKGANSINHVGLYTGNGEFLHSSSPETGVIRSDLSSGYYNDTFETARRILN